MTYLATLAGIASGFLFGAVLPSPWFWCAVLAGLLAWRWYRGRQVQP